MSVVERLSSAFGVREEAETKWMTHHIMTFEL